jgi:hypothetical protein
MNRYHGGDRPQKATSSVPQYTEEQMAASILAAGGGDMRRVYAVLDTVTSLVSDELRARVRS